MQTLVSIIITVVLAVAGYWIASQVVSAMELPRLRLEALGGFMVLIGAAATSTGVILLGNKLGADERKAEESVWAGAWFCSAIIVAFATAGVLWYILV